MKKFFAIIIIVFLCFSSVYAEEQSPAYSIQINAASRTLRLYDNGTLVKKYPVAVGKPATQTPLGNFKIRNKAVNPIWHNNGNPVAPGPRNPLGIRWMGLSVPSGTYGIHGNNTPSSINTFASKGCIRMFNNDVEELYSRVGIGTSVQIIYENIEVEQDKYTNTPVLVVYPDAYKQKNAETVLKRLMDANKSISQEQASKALKTAANAQKNPVAICNGIAVMFNNQFATNDSFLEADQIYIYYLAAFDIFGVDAKLIEGLSIPVLEKDGKVYVNLTEIASKLDCQLKFDAKTNNVYLSLNIVKVNGRYLSSYKGGFDKENFLEAEYIKKLGSYAVENTKTTGNLKELCKQLNWQLTADSLNKVLNILVPLKVRVGDSYINTELYNGKYYLNIQEASIIPNIQEQNLSLFTYKDKGYYDLDEIMNLYECQRDSYFTTVEVFKALRSEI